jgi:hypothetical protein
MVENAKRTRRLAERIAETRRSRPTLPDASWAK